MRDLTKLPMPRYIRKGKCIRCGWCCLQEDPPCQYLTKLKSGKYKCEIFGKPERPSKCLNHPGNPPIIYEGCGYWFVDRWKDGKKIKPGEKLI